MSKRRINSEEDLSALRTWAREGEGTERAFMLTAVRFLLEELGASRPGRVVGIQVPPVDAVQILPGTTYRRSTPLVVVETSVQVQFSLATGYLSREDAISDGRIQAPGERADLAPSFPHLPL